MSILSVNFTTELDAQCKCGCGFGLLQKHVDRQLVAGLQLIRDRIRRPLHCNSWCRCPAWNEHEGGAEFSQHLFGRAADIRADGISPDEMRVVAESIGIFMEGAIIMYADQGFCHVDTRWGRYRDTR